MKDGLCVSKRRATHNYRQAYYLVEHVLFYYSGKTPHKVTPGGYCPKTDYGFSQLK